MVEGVPGNARRRSGMGTAGVGRTTSGGRGRGVGSGGGLNFVLKCGRGTVRHAGRDGVGAGTKSSQTSVTARYIHRLTDEYTVMYIRRLTNECTGLSLSVHATFLSAGTEEYSPVITEEYKVYREIYHVSLYYLQSENLSVLRCVPSHIHLIIIFVRECYTYNVCITPLDLPKHSS
jgi:hypothetical protein